MCHKFLCSFLRHDLSVCLPYHLDIQVSCRTRVWHSVPFSIVSWSRLLGKCGNIVALWKLIHDPIYAGCILPPSQRDQSKGRCSCGDKRICRHTLDGLFGRLWADQKAVNRLLLWLPVVLRKQLSQWMSRPASKEAQKQTDCDGTKRRTASSRDNEAERSHSSWWPACIPVVPACPTSRPMQSIAGILCIAQN